MKKNLLAQMTLSGMLMISLIACQKKDDNKAPEAAPAAPTAPVVEKSTREQADEKLASIGLKIIDPQPVEVGEDPGFSQTASWDAKAYLKFLRGLKEQGLPRPTAQEQVDVLADYIELAKKDVQEMDAKVEGLGDDMVANANHLQERNTILARIELAQKRLDKLQDRIAKKQENPEGALTPVEEIKEDAPEEVY